MTNPNHSAYPAFIFENERAIGSSEGLTKREYFAAMALQGLLAAGDWEVSRTGRVSSEFVGERALASAAVKCADDLIHFLNAQ